MYHRTECISYLGPKLWDILPEKLKNIHSLEHFKKEIKTWKPDNCPCRLWKGMISLISIKLKISLRNSCVLYLYYHRIYASYFTVILYMRILVGLFYFILFFSQNSLCSIVRNESSRKYYEKAFPKIRKRETQKEKRDREKVWLGKLKLIIEI